MLKGFEANKEKIQCTTRCTKTVPCVSHFFFFFSASGPPSQGVYYRVTCILWFPLLSFTLKSTLLKSYFFPKYEECKEIRKREIQFFGFNAY